MLWLVYKVTAVALTFFLSKALSVLGLMRFSNFKVLFELPPPFVAASSSAFSIASACFFEIFLAVFSSVYKNMRYDEVKTDEPVIGCR